MPLSHKEFGELFSSIARLWRLRLDTCLREDESLAPFNLSLAKWRVLLRLKNSPEGLSQRQLAELVGVEGATMVGLLDRLESDGLVERCPCAGDRRSKIVHLKLAGKDLIPGIEAHVERVRQEVLGHIPDEDLVHCHGVLLSMQKALLEPNQLQQES